MDMCRICLKTSLAILSSTGNQVKLHNIDERIMKKYYFCIGFSMEDDDGQLPQVICDTCKNSLVKSFRFKQQCLETQNILNKFVEQLITFNPSPEETTKFSKNPVATEFCVMNQDVNTIRNLTETQKHASESHRIDYQEFYSISEMEDNDIVVMEHNEISQHSDTDTHDLDKFNSNEDSRDSSAESSYSLETIDFNISSPSEEIERHVPYSQYKYNLIVCHICGELKKRFHMYNHLKSHERFDPQNVNKGEDYKSGPGHKILCTICGKAVQNIKDHSSVHMNIPYEERPNPCPLCDKRFKTLNTLKGHLLTHSNEKRYECPHCGERFRGYHTKMQHITQYHTGEFRFECNFCDRKFWLMVRYKDHLRRVHKIESDKPRKKMDKPEGYIEIYSCEFCDKQFKSHRFLKEHIKIHESIIEEENDYYSCPECDFVCMQNKVLRNHIEKNHQFFELPPSNISLKSKSLKKHLEKKFER